VEQYNGPVVKCPECMKEGVTSTVRQLSVERTMLHAQEFFDEEGQAHIHDPNTFSTVYMCSNNHKWKQSQKNKCWCGWPETEVKSE